ERTRDEADPDRVYVEQDEQGQDQPQHDHPRQASVAEECVDEQRSAIGNRRREKRDALIREDERTDQKQQEPENTAHWNNSALRVSDHRNPCRVSASDTSSCARERQDRKSVVRERGERRWAGGR